MSERESGLTIEELAARVGVPVRTVRFYITEGLLPGPGARGRGASYDRDHLLRLQLIRRLGERRVPIAEIRETLTRLSTADVAALLAQETRKAAELEQTPPATSPKAYVAALLSRSGPAVERKFGRSRAAPPPPQRAASPALPAPASAESPAERAPPGGAAGDALTWQRTALAPGVELHVRGDAAVRQRPLIERILAAAGATGAPGEGRRTDAADAADTRQTAEDPGSGVEQSTQSGGGKGKGDA